MYRNYRHIAVIGQFFSVRGFENVGKERMFFWESDDHIYVFVRSNLIDGIHEIKHADERIFRFEFFQHIIQLSAFGFVFISQLDVMFRINIHNMKCWLK